MKKNKYILKLKNVTTSSFQTIYSLKEQEVFQINDMFNSVDINVISQISSYESDQIIKSLHKQSNLETLVYYNPFIGNYYADLSVLQFLEQVTTLRSLTFNQVRFQQPSLLQAFSKCLKSNQNLTSLNFGLDEKQMKLSLPIYQQISQALEHLEDLTSFTLRLSSDGEIGAEILNNAIGKMVKLKNLAMIISRFFISRCDEIKYLGMNLNTLASLQKLNISFISQQPIGLTSITALSNGFKTIFQLKSLKLTLHHISTEQTLLEVMNGVSTLANLENLTLDLKLKLSSTEIVIDMNPYLGKLVLLEELNFFVHIPTQQSLIHLSQSIGLRQLAKLKKITLFQDQGSLEVLQILDGISNLSELQKIELNYQSNVIISDEIQQVLSLSFKNLVKLSSINLFFKDCNLNQSQMQKINHAISCVQSLKTLDLHYEQSSLRSLNFYTDLGQSLTFLSNLQTLKIKIVNYSLSDNSQIDIIKGYRQLSNLNVLELLIDRCHLTTSRCILFACQSIEQLIKLQTFSLTVNQYSLITNFISYLIPITKNNSLRTVQVVIFQHSDDNYLKRKMLRLVNVPINY